MIASMVFEQQPIVATGLNSAASMRKVFNYPTVEIDRRFLATCRRAYIESRSLAKRVCPTYIVNKYNNLNPVQNDSNTHIQHVIFSEFPESGMYGYTQHRLQGICNSTKFQPKYLTTRHPSMQQHLGFWQRGMPDALEVWVAEAIYTENASYSIVDMQAKSYSILKCGPIQLRSGELLERHSWETRVIGHDTEGYQIVIVTGVWARPNVDVMALSRRGIPHLLSFYGENPSYYEDAERDSFRGV